MTGADTQMAMLPLSPAAAQEWGRQSLEGGWLLAQEVLDAYPLVSDAFVVAPMRFAEVTLTPETGQRISMRAADDFLDQEVTSWLLALGAKTVVLESDLYTRETKSLPSDVIFLPPETGYRVLEVSLRGHLSAALRDGSSGYPLNAFVSTSEPAVWEAWLRRPEPATTVDVLRSLVGLIVSACDAESYAVMTLAVEPD